MWFGFWPTSTGSVEEKVSLTKGRDYKSSTKTLSQNPNPKYTQKSSQSPEARDQRKPKFLSQNKARLRTLTCGCLWSLINQLPHNKYIYTKYKSARVYYLRAYHRVGYTSPNITRTWFTNPSKTRTMHSHVHYSSH